MNVRLSKRSKAVRRRVDPDEAGASTNQELAQSVVCDHIWLKASSDHPIDALCGAVDIKRVSFRNTVALLAPGTSCILDRLSTD